MLYFSALAGEDRKHFWHLHINIMAVKRLTVSKTKCLSKLQQSHHKHI